MTGVSRELTGEQVARLFGLVFALEQLGEHLTDLGERVDEAAGKTA